MGLQLRLSLYLWLLLPLHGTVEVRRMALNPCQLHCIANDSSVLANIAPVKDGTQCWSDKHDVCIEGECVPVGCDLQLNSGVVLDHCGVCGGNGSSCISVSRVILTGNNHGNVLTSYMRIPLAIDQRIKLSLLYYIHMVLTSTCNAGMRHVITFPVQATHAVLVLHHSSTVVILKEVASETSRILGAESSFTLGGVKWTWKHSGTKRSLIAPGPITHRVIAMVSEIPALATQCCTS